MKSIAEFFYRIKDLGFSVWLENNNLKYRQYKECSNKNEILTQIKENKDNIIKFLNINKCNNHELINPQYIYTSGNNQEILSFAQERLWFVEKYEKGTNAYNIPMVFKLNNAKLDILEQSIRSLITRHEILRTLIKEDDEGNGYQLVIDDKEFSLEITRIQVKDQSQLDQEFIKAINHVYDLSKQCPIKVCLYELSNDELEEMAREYYLSMVIHHIAFDGWSIDILLRELHAYYQYYLRESLEIESKLDLSELSIQYKDFALWQSYYLSGERLEKQLNYWKEKLNGYEILNLPTDKLRPNQVDYQGQDIYFGLDEKTSIALRELAKELKVSLYSLLLAGYYLMLSCYSNQDDIVIGTPVANRHYPQIENLIGFFVNSLVLRTKINPKCTVKEFIKKIGEEIVEAQLHQDLPFEKLVEELKVTKDTSRHPIFQVLFGVQSFGRKVYDQVNFKSTADVSNILQGYTTEISLYNVARFDISTFIDDSEVCLSGCFNYRVSLYTEATINRFIETYVNILKELATLVNNIEKQEQTKLFNLNYLNKEQYEQLIYTWNQTDSIYPDNKTIHELFEEQAEKTPDNVALIYEDQCLTYQEVNERSNKVADYLRSLGASPEVLIGIGIDRQVELIIGLMGILKTGAAYVPLDPEYPEERLKYMIEDSNIQILLVTTASKDKFNYYEKKFVYVDQLDYSNTKQAQKFSPNLTPDNLAYVIYTSGSTGKPKGVACHHRGVINRLKWAWDKYPFSKNEVCCLQSSICFVDSTWDIFGTLLIGYPLVLYKASLGKTVDSFLHQCFLSKITRITLLPSFLEELIKLAQTDINIFNHFKQIKHLEVTGEFFKPNIFLNFIQTFGSQVTFLDCYGATEATSVVYKDFNQKNKCLTRIISNTKIYVLSDHLNPVPIGSIGELYIGGIGLARGYLNKPELTAERFIANPFITEEELKQNRDTRLYKTGDLVRWLPDGNLEYIGRNDFQVKIRGYRIELGEIENILSSYEGIKQSVVVAKDHKSSDREPTGNRYLIGYYVSASKLNEEAILNYLQAKLPGYMIPSALVHLEQLPLTSNGKVNRKALPDPEFTNCHHYIAPRNDLENKVCQIWGEVLGLTENKISVHDDFFRLGGNSILAIKLTSKINKALNITISVSSIFKHNTVAKLAGYLEHNTEDEIIINQINFTQNEKRLLSFAQERLWFIEKYEEGTSAYNIPLIFKVNSDVKIDILEKSLRSIVERHEILRTLVKEDVTGVGYQLVMDNEKFPLEIKKIITLSRLQLDEAIQKEVHHIFDLSQEYPIKVCLYALTDRVLNNISESYLSLVIHHIAFDGWSTDILLKELQAYYHYYLAMSQGLNVHLNLPRLTIQYKDFALWQRDYLSGEKLDKQLNYWKNKLNGYETLNLITDKSRDKEIDYRGADAYFILEEEISIELRRLAKELKVSLYSLLLSGFYIMLRCYSHQDDIVIGTSVANRHYGQIENLIGFFVNALALRTQINPKMLVKEFIQRIGSEVVEAQLYQDLPFEKLVEELKISKDTSRHPIFQVTFGVQGFGSSMYNEELGREENKVSHIVKGYLSENIVHKVARFDMSLFINDSQTRLSGVVNYAIGLYKETTIQGFIETYKEILNQLVNLIHNEQKQKNMTIGDLSYISRDAYDKVVNRWNQTSKYYPNNKTIQTLFEEQVNKTPDNIAVICAGNSVTYKDLNERANKLGHYLRELGVGSDTLVAMAVERSLEIIIGLLGVLKAGGAYIPLDPNSPVERLQCVFEDSLTPVILTDRNTNNKLPTTFARIVLLDEEWDLIDKYPSTNPDCITLSSNLAYVIYTSGTTGDPKGVMVEHKSVINLAIMQGRKFGLINAKRIKNCLWYSNYVFDAHVSELYTSILNGHAIHIISNEIRQDIQLLSNYIQENSVDIATIPPALLNNQDLLKLDLLVVAGDKTAKEVLDFYHSNNIKVINAYGPSETTVCSSLNHYTDNGAANIGSQIFNTTAYVLDANLNPLPIGAVGELYIGGVGLARGYLNKPDLTAEKFIANPFQVTKEECLYTNDRLYKTGDLVRWNSEGNLEYIRREDSQIKISGYRIELGEIESGLSSYPGVKQSIVLVKEHINKDGTSSDNKFLVGYYVSDAKLEKEDIVNHLKKRLPEYMLPNTLVSLERIPLTANGKVDIKAFPEPALTLISNYVAPRNELENLVCQIWSEVIGLEKEKIGIKDDFFKLGGNSILAIRLASKINHYYKSHLKVSDIFAYKTIELLIPRILQTKDTYQTIIKLNNTYDKPNMFMVHPAIGGCEVYASLATILADNFSCYGVDPYNLYNEIKIDNLNELAEYYLSYIDKIMAETHQKVYHLLGWSMGGQISLEMASILERKGHKKIKVYLLDSILLDEDFAYLDKLDITIEELKNRFTDYAILNGYDQSYIEKSLSNMDVEKALVKQKISSMLTNTKVLLFKAMVDRHCEDKYNYVGKILKNKSNIKLIKANNAHHGNILEQEELLFSGIMEFTTELAVA